MDIKALFALAGLNVDNPQKILELYRASLGLKKQFAIMSAAMDIEVDHIVLSKLSQISSIVRAEPCVRYRKEDDIHKWFNPSLSI